MSSLRDLILDPIVLAVILIGVPVVALVVGTILDERRHIDRHARFDHRTLVDARQRRRNRPEDWELHL